MTNEIVNEGVEKGKEIKKASFDIQVAKGQMEYDVLSGAPKDAVGRLSYYMRLKSTKQKLVNTKRKISSLIKSM